jgi:hypothetical protein
MLRSHSAFFIPLGWGVFTLVSLVLMRCLTLAVWHLTRVSLVGLALA